MQIFSSFSIFHSCNKSSKQLKTFSLNSVCINFLSQFAKMKFPWNEIDESSEVGDFASCITSHQQLFFNFNRAVVVIKSLLHVVVANFSCTSRCFSHQRNAKVSLTRLKQILFSSPRCLLRHKEKNSPCTV